MLMEILFSLIKMLVIRILIPDPTGTWLLYRNVIKVIRIIYFIKNETLYSKLGYTISKCILFGLAHLMVLILNYCLHEFVILGMNLFNYPDATQESIKALERGLSSNYHKNLLFQTLHQVRNCLALWFLTYYCSWYQCIAGTNLLTFDGNRFSHPGNNSEKAFELANG
jgi:hypothetical protein